MVCFAGIPFQDSTHVIRNRARPMRTGTADPHACAATRSTLRSLTRWLPLLACLALLPVASAATVTWSGLGGDDMWSTGGNWVGGVAPSAGDDLVFAGTTRLTPTSDYGNATSFATITFDNTAGAFTIGGNRIAITGAITNDSTATETLACDISGTYGVGGNSGAIVLSGGLGLNGLVTKSGTHTLTLSGTTDNVGLAVTANAGTLILAKTSTSNVHCIGGATLTVSGATVKLGGTGGDQLYDDATILVNSGTFDTNGLSEAFNTLSSGAAGVVDNTGGGASVLTIGQTGGGSGILGTVRNTSGTLALVKAGTGTMVLSGTNTYSGGTTITGGKLSYPGDAALSGTGAIILNGGTLLHTGPSTLANAVSVTASSTIESDDGDDLTLTTSSFSGTAGTVLSLSDTTNSGIHSLILTGSGFTYAGGIALDSNSRVFCGNTSGTQTFTGVISGLGNGAGVDGAVKRSAAGGFTTLAGANTYVGGTLVDLGTLTVTGSTSSSSAVTVASGGTLAGTGTVAGTVGVASGGTVSPGIPGLRASFVASSLRAVTEDDWRLTRTITGTRADDVISQSSAFGTAAQRAAYGIGGSDADWDNFSVQWDGYLQVPVGGTTLYTRSDDGSRVWLDRNGNGLVEGSEWGSNSWGTGQGETSRPVQATLAAGTYRMRVQYEEGIGGDAMYLLWDDATHSAGSVAGLSLVPAAFLAGGSSIGTLTTGAVTFTGSPVLSLDLDGTGPTADRLSTSGAVICAGTLNVSTIAHAALGRVYTVVSAGSVTGTFTGLANGDLFAGAGRIFQIAYTATTVTLTEVAHPTTRVWDGGGADNNWSTAANWDFDIAPVAGDSLVFAGSTRLAPINDFPPETTFASITFNAGAGAFVIGPAATSGVITREVWTGIGGNAVSQIPVTTTPSISDTLTTFEGPSNWADSYGTRIRGFLTAPTTGTYTFWIATDDNGELWLSTDTDPANKVLIASVPNFTGIQQWNVDPLQKSAPIALVAGQRYYIEALQKEGGGGDNIAVGWAKPGESTAAPSQVIPGSQLAPYATATGIVLTGNVTNSSVTTQTVDLGLHFAATRTVDAASGAIAIRGVVSGAGGLAKAGSAPLTLGGTNTFAGGTSLTAGTLAINNASALGGSTGTFTIAAAPPSTTLLARRSPSRRTIPRPGTGISPSRAAARWTWVQARSLSARQTGRSRSRPRRSASAGPSAAPADSTKQGAGSLAVYGTSTYGGRDRRPGRDAPAGLAARQRLRHDGRRLDAEWRGGGGRRRPDPDHERQRPGAQRVPVGPGADRRLHAASSVPAERRARRRRFDLRPAERQPRRRRSRPGRRQPGRTAGMTPSVGRRAEHLRRGDGRRTKLRDQRGGR